jgi:hypothetical protein
LLSEIADPKKCAGVGLVPGLCGFLREAGLSAVHQLRLYLRDNLKLNLGFWKTRN